jgi:polyisoprenoid-binding protein YceI
MLRGEDRPTRINLPVPASIAMGAAASRTDVSSLRAGVPGAARAPLAPQAWRFDTVHSSIHFSVRRLLVSRVHGEFTKWRGTMTFDPARPEASQLSVRIDAGSIDTGEPERDAHLRSPDFLHAEQHPVLTFQSARVLAVDATRLAVTGALQIRGVTREVTLDATYRGTVRDEWGNDHLVFTATTRIERGAFGLKWNQVMPTGELFVGESVEISMDIEATRLPVNVA